MVTTRRLLEFLCKPILASSCLEISLLSMKVVGSYISWLKKTLFSPNRMTKTVCFCIRALRDLSTVISILLLTLKRNSLCYIKSFLNHENFLFGAVLAFNEKSEVRARTSAFLSDLTRLFERDLTFKALATYATHLELAKEESERNWKKRKTKRHLASKPSTTPT